MFETWQQQGFCDCSSEHVVDCTSEHQPRGTYQHGMGMLGDEERALQKVDVLVWSLHVLLICLQSLHSPETQEFRVGSDDHVHEGPSSKSPLS